MAIAVARSGGGGSKMAVVLAKGGSMPVGVAKPQTKPTYIADRERRLALLRT